MGRILSNQEITWRLIDDAHGDLTPSPEEQIIRILKGLCPHNEGWSYAGHSHNDDAYKCRLCGDIDFI